AARPHPGVVYRELEGAFSDCELLCRPEPPAPAVNAIAELAQRLFSDADDASIDGRGALELGTSGP
ncbi:MAG TPA: hypothetical protein VHX88_10120, partial [Solirubrobacteraceae bacterium]|nr:hypothetical protein [Solirubrobacteraceae bacterium]